MKIEFNKVTWYSKFLTLLVMIGTLFLGFYLGQKYGVTEYCPLAPTDYELENKMNSVTINSAVFNCSEGKRVSTVFYKGKVVLDLSDGRNMVLPQAISASGARYANKDETIVFWNKGDAAFITEGDKETYSNCVTSN